MNFRPRMHAAVLLHNLGFSQCTITVLNAAGHRVSNVIKDKIVKTEQATKTSKSISQSANGKKKRAKMRNYKQKQKYDDTNDAKVDGDEDEYKTDRNLPSTSQKWHEGCSL